MLAKEHTISKIPIHHLVLASISPRPIGHKKRSGASNKDAHEHAETKNTQPQRTIFIQLLLFKLIMLISMLAPLTELKNDSAFLTIAH